MEVLPNELIIEQLINMSYESMINLIKAQKTMYTIYKDNKDYIYRKRILYENPCMETQEELYLILSKRVTHENLCDKKMTYESIKCYSRNEAFKEYEKCRINKNINTDYYYMIRRCWILHKCFSLLKNDINLLIEMKNNIKDYENFKGHLNSPTLLAKWNETYKKYGKELLKMIETRFDDIENSKESEDSVNFIGPSFSQ